MEPTTLEIDLSPHAISRYAERVRPALDLDAAADELAHLATFAELSERPPAWLAARQHDEAPLYLLLGDVRASVLH